MIHLRAAEPQDEAYFLALRREIQSNLTSEEHSQWWETFEHRFVAADGALTVGVIRITNLGAGDGLVHLQVSKAFQGKGYGTEMLLAVKQQAEALGFRVLHATVSRENGASQAAFTRAGWKPTLFEVAL